MEPRKLGIFERQHQPLARPVAIIPARYGASRFPGKPLALLLGRPMIAHVIERCRESGAFEAVVVATDDERIAGVAAEAGADPVRTSPECPSGTDRVAEAARALGLSPERVVINVQGDEPAVHPQALVALARAFDDDTTEMATLVRALDEAERTNPHVVKAVLDLNGFALYFSRADIPYARPGESVADPPRRAAHLGLYGYRMHTLQRLASLKPSPLERAEGLEQLRALEHGVHIACRWTPHASAAVDRPEDLANAEAALRKLAPST